MAAVGRAGMGSTHHERPAGVARSLQPGKHPVRTANAQRRDVLNHHPTRSALAHEAELVLPQAASLTIQPGPGSGGTDILAWEATADETRIRHAVRMQATGREGADVVITGHIWPVAPQDAAGMGGLLAEGHGLASGALEAEGETTDAAEEVKDEHKRNLGKYA